MAASDHEGFFIACSKDYDRDIDILHSKRESFHASVDKFLEPGLFKVYDMKLTKDKDSETGEVKQMLSILCVVGDYLSLEVIETGLGEVEET